MPFLSLKDQMGRSVEVPFPPQRIISLVPSQTELLFDLGMDKQVVGLTKFCIHPKEKTNGITKIGGTKMLNTDLIRSLKPDLVIGNKEENERTQVENLMSDLPVWMSDISNLVQAQEMIAAIGHLTDRRPEASYLNSLIATGMNDLGKYLNDHYPHRAARVAYFIWKNPYMVAGKDTFINDMLTRLGMVNVFKEERYPAITADQLADAGPDHIFLSSEPYPFAEKHMDEFKAICPRAKVRVVDGEMFSWYGSRLRHVPGYFIELARQLYT